MLNVTPWILTLSDINTIQIVSVVCCTFKPEPGFDFHNKKMRRVGKSAETEKVATNQKWNEQESTFRTSSDKVIISWINAKPGGVFERWENLSNTFASQAHPDDSKIREIYANVKR